MRGRTSDLNQLPRELLSDYSPNSMPHTSLSSPVPNLSQPLIWRRAVVTYNNQNSVLLKLNIDSTSFCLLHDNRLFRFSLDDSNIVPRGAEVELAYAERESRSMPSMECSVDELQTDPEMFAPRGRAKSWSGSSSKRNVINPLTGGDLGTTVGDGQRPVPEDFAMAILLRFQTSPKYRLLNSLYFAFRLLDNLLLLTIVVLTALKHKLTMPEFGQRAVYSAVGLELFYDVMLYTTKYWFLERLSIYVGIGLYMMYFSIVAIFPELHTEYVVIVILCRLCAFIFEESLDVAIDIEMHNDLIFVCDKKVPLEDSDNLHYTDVRRALLDFPYVPTSSFFTGSGSAWLPQSAFADQTYSRKRFSPWSFRWLYIVPFLLCSPCIFGLGVFVSVPLIIFLIIDQLCHVRDRARGTSLWAELSGHY